MTIAEFLAARLDEDEAAAKACQAPSPWKAADQEWDHWIITDATGDVVIYDEGTPSLEEAAHIARHDPARVLRDVAADRKLLAAYAHALTADFGITGEPYDAGWAEALELAVKIRAARFGDHPDYQKQWAP
ncbi:MAG: DUF6221 family protein [Streptosporangiaceae bacterium]